MGFQTSEVVMQAPHQTQASFRRTPVSFEYQYKRMSQCCRDSEDWARPPLDLHQRHSILMFQSPVSTFKTLQPHAPSEKLLRMSAITAWTTDYLSDRSRLARLGLPL